MRVQEMEIRETISKDPEYHDIIEPQELAEAILKKESYKWKPTWACELLQEAERYRSLEGLHREK